MKFSKRLGRFLAPVSHKSQSVFNISQLELVVDVYYHVSCCFQTHKPKQILSSFWQNYIIDSLNYLVSVINRLVNQSARLFCISTKLINAVFEICMLMCHLQAW